MSAHEQQITNFLMNTGFFAASDVEDFLCKRTSAFVKKGDFFVKEGQFCRSIYFLHSGLITLFLLKDGEEHVKDFSMSGKFITAYTSFMTGAPSQIYLRAEQDCEVSVWKGEYLQDLIAHYPQWTKFAKSMAEYLFFRKEKREISLLLDTAEERYLHLIADFPALIQQVPQYLLASYLGIKPQSLSRIRTLLAHKH